MAENLPTVLEVLNNAAWFDELADEVETESGADATGVTIDADGVTIHAHEKFGDGRTPYASHPGIHQEMVTHETFDHGEGIVTYEDGPTEEYPLDLPKHLYFEERRPFEDTAETVEQLEEELSAALGVKVTISDIVASDILNE